jgi:hypothetical protein
MQERRNAYEILTGQCEFRGPPGRLGNNIMYNIKMDSRDIPSEDMNWVMCLRTGSIGMVFE